MPLVQLLRLALARILFDAVILISLLALRLLREHGDGGRRKVVEKVHGAAPEIELYITEACCWLSGCSLGKSA